MNGYGPEAERYSGGERKSSSLINRLGGDAVAGSTRREEKQVLGAESSVLNERKLEVPVELCGRYAQL